MHPNLTSKVNSQPKELGREARHRDQEVVVITERGAHDPMITDMITDIGPRVMVLAIINHLRLPLSAREGEDSGIKTPMMQELPKMERIKGTIMVSA